MMVIESIVVEPWAVSLAIGMEDRVCAHPLPSRPGPHLCVSYVILQPLPLCLHLYRLRGVLVGLSWVVPPLVYVVLSLRILTPSL
jgi:hypothetical protein